MVAIDNTFLSLMLNPRGRPPKDPATGKFVERIDDRIEKLLLDLDSESERMILPTPVLSEFLIYWPETADPQTLKSFRE